MTAPWRCAVCEGVNADGRTCAACGRTRTRKEQAQITVLEQVDGVARHRLRPHLGFRWRIPTGYH
jgi:hypothetical protein